MITKLEQLGRDYFNEILPELRPVYNFRPDWLKNPDTGKNLELDIFYPDIQVAIEMNGIGHTLKYQKFKDNIKKERCRWKNIKLYQVSGRNLKYLFTIGYEILGKRKRVSNTLHKKIRYYKPKQNKFGNQIGYIRGIERSDERCKTAQEKETAFNKLKIEIKRGLNR